MNDTTASPWDYTGDPDWTTQQLLPETVALVLDANGHVFDQPFTWEAGQTYANQGYRVLAVSGDGHLTREEAQGMYVRELNLWRDCFHQLPPLDTDWIERATTRLGIA